jgi:acyl-CoA dehydrogenase
MTAHTGVTFQLSPEQKELQLLARDFARNEIAPVAAEYDKTHAFPWPVVKKGQELGLTTQNIPEEYGGLGLSLFEEILVTEELAWGCSGISTAIGATLLGLLPIKIAGSEAQKKEYFGRIVEGALCAYCVTEPEAGSDVAGMLTTARRDGDHYILNGQKTFITGAPEADFYTVFAYTDRDKKHKGISGFIVDRNWPGVSVTKPFEKLGQHASSTAGVILEDVRVPATHLLGKEGIGFLIAMQVFDKSRPGTAAGAIGLAQRALDESIRYAKERISFGVPIWQHQAVGHMIADMAMDVEAARLLVWRSACAVDAGAPDTKLASFGKAYAADMAMRVSTNAVQVFGGYGYMSEYPVEKLMRDAKIFQIYEGTSQIQRNIIVRELFAPRRG